MLEGWEWIIIGVVAVVIILWGPAKIPEFAKALGRAKGEFNKATQEFKEAAKDNPPITDSRSALKTQKSKDEMLIDTARSLGISTEGKTREQLTEEISLRISQLKAD
ncbi:MAG: twin-arginine translocase TatA/TatE family subunit [Chloroflexota bacterium]|jgi:sec-independent protein translocase protein TatA|nr:twin-arginine translocase TatA/TatE family subunit [Candidatus Sulfotelmatobacter sp.]